MFGDSCSNEVMHHHDSGYESGDSEFFNRMSRGATLLMQLSQEEAVVKENSRDEETIEKEERCQEGHQMSNILRALLEYPRVVFRASNNKFVCLPSSKADCLKAKHNFNTLLHEHKNSKEVGEI